MRPQTIGRVLGIGVRLAGRVAGQAISAGVQTAANAPAVGAPNSQTAAYSATRSRTAGQAAGQASRGLAHGLSGFLRPFRRVGGILWLEVTGVFVLLPVFVFTPTLWRTRASYLHGPDHRTFLVTAVVVVVFLYLGVTSFWRARKR